MKLIVGLGNPGAIYKDSRHNIGFLTVKALAYSSKAVFKRDIGTRSLSAKINASKLWPKDRSLLSIDTESGVSKKRGLNAAECIRYRSQNIVLAMPQTFMNLSGPAVKALLKKYKVDLGGLLVVCDDLDLEFGRLKIKTGGTSAGHRGVQSVIESLASDSFARLRVGIGRPAAALEASEYVLSPFTKKEKEPLADIIEKAAECCKAWSAQGITEAMDMYNKRSEGE